MTEIPWLDLPNGLERARARTALPAADLERLAKWDRDGFIIVEGAIPPARIDALVADLDRVIWDAKDARPGLVIAGGAHGTAAPVAHSELVAMSREQRLAMRDGTAWQVPDFFKFSEAAAAVAFDPGIERLIELILDRPSKVRSSVTLWKGKETRLHQDGVLFACLPFNMKVTIGIACEDVDPDSGPVLLYAGSHRLPRWDGWTDYPATMLRTCTPDTAEAYHRWLEGRAREFPARPFVVRKGDAVLWHGSLAHKASDPRNPALTQKLCVLHSSPDGCDRTAEILATHAKRGNGATS